MMSDTKVFGGVEESASRSISSDFHDGMGELEHREVIQIVGTETPSPSHHRASIDGEESPAAGGEEEEELEIEIAGETGELKRTLGFWQCLSLVTGIIIGTGIFASPGQVLEKSGSVGLCFVVWGFSGAYALLGAMIYSELGAAFPTSGGEYVYIREGLHPILGFLNVFSDVVVIKAASQAIISLVFARYFCASLVDIAWAEDPNVDSFFTVKLVAVAVLVALTAVNIFGVEWAAKLQTAFLATKGAAISLVVLFGLWAISFGGQGHQFNTNMSGLWQFADAGFSFFSLAAAIVAAQWAYDGWSDLGMVAGEVINPRATLSRSIIAGTAFVCAAFLLINISYLMILPKSEVVRSAAIGIAAAHAVGGTWAAGLMSLLISFSALGTLNGSILTGARKIYAASLTGEFPLPRVFSHVGSLHTPYPALLLQFSLSFVLVIPSNFTTLVSLFGVMSVVFYGLSAVALMRLRWTRPDLDRPYRVFYPFVPVAFILFCLFILFVSFGDPDTSLVTVLSFAFQLFGVLLWFVFFSPSASLKRFCLILRLGPEDRLLPFEQDLHDQPLHAPSSCTHPLLFKICPSQQSTGLPLSDDETELLEDEQHQQAAKEEEEEEEEEEENVVLLS